MKQMRKKLLLVGILAVTLSTISATQYVRADLGFSYEIVHPSESDIRYIGSDLAPDGNHVLRSEDDASVKLEFGKWSAGQTKVYTAAFGIVNEEMFPVRIKNVVVTDNTGSENASKYIQIWLHGNQNFEAKNETQFLLWNGSAHTGLEWTLAAGNRNSSNMDGTNTTTSMNTNSKVHVPDELVGLGANGTHDFVWVQIVITAPDNDIKTFDGNIQFTFESVDF
jgi:hypothetical protein